jgi:acetyl-CoA acetyltransferase
MAAGVEKLKDNPYTREIAVEDVLKARTVAWPLGLYDCCGVSDGAAVAIITRWPEVLRPPDRWEWAADDL